MKNLLGKFHEAISVLYFFLSGKFHEKFVRKISCRKHASAFSGLVSGGARGAMAPPLTRPLVLSKAKHCQAVLSKAKHWHAVMSEVPFKTSTPFKFKKI